MSVIIGIDPGSRLTGFGVIQLQGQHYRYLASGCLRVGEFDLGERLQKIYAGLKEIIQQYQPTEAAIEQIFMHANPASALKLGQARGAAIVALGLPVAEYSARQVKQSVVGYGAAEKPQVQQMVKHLLSINEKLQSDAADALAVALCHAHTRTNYHLQTKSTSWRKYRP